MITISIEYQRKEYLAIIRDMLELELDLSKGTLNKWYTRTPIAFCFSLVFWFKVRREGVCLFEFNETFFTRKSKTGQSQVDWNKLEKVIDLDNAYIIIGASKGMAPIPKRCFTREEAKHFESYIVTKLEN